MRLAHRELEVPMVLEPEYLASPWLDELSGMTYLSYFMKPDSAGFRSTLEWVNSRLERPITNFTVSCKRVIKYNESDWLYEIVDNDIFHFLQFMGVVT